MAEDRGADWYRAVDWSQTSFADVTEAAVHYALIEFHLATERRIETQSRWSDQSDIYRQWRCTITDLVRGEIDPAEWLAQREASDD